MTINPEIPDNLPAVPTDSVLALNSDDEWGDVDSGFIGEAPPEAAPVVPRLSLNAKTGGGFTDELTNTKYGEGDKFSVVWLAWSESRAYWKEAFGQGDKAPTCRSNNMIVPDDGSTEKQSETCAACPHSKWLNGESPKCGLRMNVMLYLPDQHRITRTAFGGLAIKHVQRYLGGFSTRLPQRPPMSVITEITVAKEQTGFGDFLVPNFRVVGDITRAEAAPLIALRDELRKEWEALAEQDLAEGDGHVVPQQQGDPFAPREGEVPFDDGDFIVDAEIVDEVPPAPTVAPQDEDF